MRWRAVEESVCQWCGARIYLVRVTINNWEWVTDRKRPYANWKCYADAEWPAGLTTHPHQCRACWLMTQIIGGRERKCVPLLER